MKALIESIKHNKTILFIGSGVSKNLGLPTWDGLISKMAEDLEFDEEIFKTFGDYLTLAEYYKSRKTTIGSLRRWMDTNWHDSKIDLKKSEVHKIIVELDFPIIYTTNYDRWIEKCFDHYGKDYNKIVNVGDISKIQDGVTQIVKLHGDFGDDSTLVLTESSYFDRLNFESPLDIKLRSDILDKSILFIGYSLKDINMRYLLYKLHNLWEKTPYKSMRPKSFIFLSRPNPIQKDILENRGINVLISDCDDPKEGLTKFLKDIKDQVI